MNEENKVNYYAIIPATVRYNKELKPSERLIYGELTALANRNGYCYAQNKYFADLYGVTNGTVSKWLSHLQQLGYIKIEIKRNDKQEIIARHIYINDIPYGQKEPYPYNQKKLEPVVQNDIDNNTDKKIDDLFILIINNDRKISNNFYSVLQRLEFIYTEELLSIMKKDKIQMLKEIIYTLHKIYHSEFSYILNRCNRDELINLYITCNEYDTQDFLQYYKKTIINKYANNS